MSRNPSKMEASPFWGRMEGAPNNLETYKLKYDEKSDDVAAHVGGNG